MLIRDATLLDGAAVDIRIDQGRIGAIGKLAPRPREAVLDARGGLLLPGLHDHHIHLAALAAAASSVRCGPPDVADADALAAALRRPGSGWLRATGYHESVAGLLDAAALDRIVADRPVRVQHRGGRMWFFNSAGLAMLLAGGTPPPGLDRTTGRLFDEDGWLRRALAGTPPALDLVGSDLAAFGITGVTDMSPTNDVVIAAHFGAERARCALPQRVLLAGRPDLADARLGDGIALGPVKLHLHEAELPALANAVALVAQAHTTGRGVAIHCVSQVELLFALAAIEDAGPAGDRIEHASIATPDDVARIAALGLSVAVQPNFVFERGDAYREDVAAEDQPHLYRLRSFEDAGVPLAGGSDAPFGRPDPWAAMAAATSRRTRGGHAIGPDEALSPEDALALFLRDPQDFTRTRTVDVGASADLCLLDRPWSQARTALSAECVRATIVDGKIVHERIDEAPTQRRLRADTAA